MLSKSGSSGLTEYVYGIQYGDRNGSYGIDFIKTEEGRAVRYSDNSYRYHYDLKDHLGNIRVTFDKDPASGQARKIQEDEYYPFGKRKSVPLTSGAISQDNKYLYNGKDIQDELGQYDYGARFYDPEIARWNVIDPLSESFSPWSPYTYVFNSPVNLTDPDGRAPQDWIIPKDGYGPRRPVWRDDVTSADDPDIPFGYEYFGKDRYLHGGRIVKLGHNSWDWEWPTEGLNDVPYLQTVDAFQNAIRANMPALTLAAGISETTALISVPGARVAVRGGRGMQALAASRWFGRLSETYSSGMSSVIQWFGRKCR